MTDNRPAFNETDHPAVHGGPTLSEADTAAKAFVAGGRRWQDRAVAPPPYFPTAEQVDRLWRSLVSFLTGNLDQSYAGARHLRVVRLTSPAEPEQRFSLEVATQEAAAPAQYSSLVIVDELMRPAEWTPPTVSRRVSDRQRIADLEAQVASLLEERPG